MKKKKKLFTLIVLGLLTFNAFPQSCLPEGITFSNQNQIDSFQQNYPGCIEIEGNVRISAFGPLTNLNGLSVLKSIGGYFEVYNNNSLTNLEGLNNLTFISGYFEIHENDNLVNLSGLDSLSYIGDYFQIYDNGNLTNLIGLENLDSIGGYFNIFYNFELISLNGLENLTSISSHLAIGANIILYSLEGLDNLTSIGNGLHIGSNYSLINLNGIENLNSIGGELQIGYNYALNSISSLENIIPSSIQGLLIEKNYELSTCEIQSICDYLANPNGSVEIQNNAVGCNSREQVEEACLVSIPLNINFVDFKNSPNPFTTSTTFDYLISTPTQVTLSIFNSFGELVHQVKEQQQLGTQSVKWDAEGLPAGVYFYQLEFAEQMVTGKLVLMR